MYVIVIVKQTKFNNNNYRKYMETHIHVCMCVSNQEMPWFQTDVYLQTLELSQAKRAFQSIVITFLPTLDSTSKPFKKL